MVWLFVFRRTIHYSIGVRPFFLPLLQIILLVQTILGSTIDTVTWGFLWLSFIVIKGLEAYGCHHRDFSAVTVLNKAGKQPLCSM
ncbi:hypothetical protein BDW59DRAFT_5736 [Aspergillus cavernicola]|uniref:Uncharacterized protein n=1 Tax=Aspergillus cavernicola TaxID=176166 RepID=A0ABR4J645_9EURO